MDAHATGLPADAPVLTPRGPVPAGQIAPGDLVFATGGAGAPFQPVMGLRRHRARCALVHIAAGAIADAGPTETLILPPDVGLLIDGALVRAMDLVDGAGITRDAAAAEHDFIEILLPAHDALLVAGLAVESGVPDAADAFAPRRAPDGPLLAMLAWRAEQFGWRAAAAPAPGPPEVGTRRLRLSALPLTPVLRTAPPGVREDAG
ncbi:Hint domain-containing protein [Roseomonas sp. PWR1]|uniref:Hint domain-containing protein n=1 Tax=Roseomonas nitratireducens TaxID=2820810 RepID=A0ABS4ANI9_9PROT|nr:Hint domain-containing protein [Neoroseomonas nitratireducens]MBP0462931.1 Hint domain-containing protein [Neoroseomonas nitratireducens]